MPPSETSTGFAEAQRDRLRRRVVDAAVRRIGRQQRRVRRRGRGEDHDQGDDERAQREEAAIDRGDHASCTRSRRRPAQQPHHGEPHEVEDVLHLAERRGVPGGDVEQRRADQAHDQRGDHRQQAGDARRLPRGVEEADAERDVERADVAGGVHRQPGVGAEASARGSPPRSAPARWPPGSSAARGWCRRLGAVPGVGVEGFGTDRGEDARGEVGDRGRGREPDAAVQPLGVVGEPAAVGAPGEVGVDRRLVEPGSSPSSRAEIAWRICMQVIRGSRRSGSGGSRQYRRSPWTSSRGCSSPHATVTAPRSSTRSATSQADVWRLARHLVGPDDADDVTQDTFVRAWRALPAFRGDSSARTWLLSIARRACADAVRRNVRRRRLAARLEHRGVAPGRGAAPSTRAARTRSRRWSTSSPPTSAPRSCSPRSIGCSYAEAAEACGVPIGTIRSRVARAREHLVETLRASETG